MRLSLAARLVYLLGVMLAVRPAHSMQFEQIQISATEHIVGGRGPIVEGDAARLEQALAAVPQTRRLLALALDSPGGLVEEGKQLAGLIRTRKLAVVIPSNSKCVSACFLLFAASPHRMAATDALVGVHSANENHEETRASLAVTTLMARGAAQDGIPAGIIAKIVETTPGRVEWLTRDDLISMNVTVFDGDTPAATRQTSTASNRPLAAPIPSQPTPPPPARATAPPGFTAGHDDRRAWDGWLAGLHGPYRDGAAFAEKQIGLPQPGSCYGPSGVNRGDFTLGCQIARQRLAAVEARLRGNPDYTAGWTGTDQSMPAGQPTEAEYQGVLFCGTQAARLSLKVFAQPDAPRRRAMFSFGPQPTSPGVPRGAFIVEGAVDLHGGAMTLSPVTWVLQPAGYNWLGLSGRSDDGGKTFSGRATESSTCTVFTLKRIGNASATR